MIADHYGHKMDLHAMRQRFSVSSKGMTLETLMGYSTALNLSSRALKSDMGGLARLKLPSILHWNLDHFVVLRAISKSASGERLYLIVDPAVGERKLSQTEVSHCFTGVALELMPSPMFTQAISMRRISIRDLVGNVFGLRAAIVQLVGLAFVLEFLGAFGPLLNQIIIDEIIVTGDVSLLNLIFLCFALIAITQGAINWFRSWVLLRWTADVGIQWSSRLLHHMLKLPPIFFEKRNVGDILSRFASLGTVQNILSSLFLESLLDLIMMLFAGFFMFSYSPRLAIICLAAGVLYFVLRMAMYPAFRRANHERILLAAKENSFFMETIRGVLPLKLFGVEHDRIQMWRAKKMAVVERDLETQRMDMFFRLTSTAINTSKAFLILYLGAKLVIDGLLSLGMLMALIGYTSVFSSRFTNLVDVLMRFRILNLHNERVAEIALEEEEPGPLSLTDPTRLDPIVTLKGVRFRYAAGDPWILDGVDLVLHPNQTVALVGKSGCGKTTLVKIILGLLSPTEGDVLIDGVPVHKLGLTVYRQLIGTVMQDDVLLSGSVLENICFFSQHVDRTHAVECAKLAGVHGEIAAMPMGYETFVGELGSVLSAGQKQRVLLARALYKKPRILVIDEGTSNLDVPNERRVSQAVAGLNLTRLVVAHRPETIKMADRIATLYKGRTHETSVPDPVQEALPTNMPGNIR
jgi:ATP-binding cassette subfamily B protein RaxB